ncbi:MAG: filamentous hemagglutinin N-terminal domain-containing protein [Oscillatoriales cyanobacterium SM2_1_8]|nr:filamentous hemagglutinin N-terminal domain-containing protein [Oscillatoriales cyanobacterium SM2_1_8]
MEQGTLRQIEGGRLEGANLFHWFRVLDVPTGTQVRFQNDLGVQNVLARVTGGLPSRIDGVLAANGTANLFLVNPSGIVFGPNAQLNLGGSFLATTAETVVFGEGAFGRSPAPSPVLRVGVPLGLQFGENPAPIGVFGNGQPASTVGVARPFDPALGGLRVTPGQTIAWWAETFWWEGGILQAPGGEVVLGGLAGPGSWGLPPTVSNWGRGCPPATWFSGKMRASTF